MRPLSRLVLAWAVVLTAGCADEPVNLPGRGASSSSGPADGNAPKLRKVIGEKTQDIKDMQAEVATNPGQVNVASQKIVAKDPITLQGNAYLSAVGRISIDQIGYAIRLFEASEGRYPKDYEEFMERIIRENNIALPQLPGFQEYAYDEATHSLVVLEYPDRKAALLEQVRGDTKP